jgi:AraC-like DNA-binding protein
MASALLEPATTQRPHSRGPVVARLVVDQWLLERAPAPDLAAYVVCTWRGDLGAMALPLPDECLDLVCVNDGSIWLSGPETRSWPRGYPPGTAAVGLRFKPGVGPAVLGLAASDVRDTRVRIDELWGDRKARELSERVFHQLDDRARALEVEGAVRGLVASARPVDEVALEVADRLSQPRPVSVRDLRRTVGFSERQIHRRCTAAFGYGPAALVRILRLHRVLGLARAHKRLPGLADLAATAGYFDQQHLSHDVRSIVGTTPGTLLAAPDFRSVHDVAA